MTEVVQRLGLNETYTVRKGLKDVELYKSSPLAVTYRHLDETPVGFTIDISSKETFVISDMEVNGKAFGEDFSGKMGDSIRTEIGTLVINFTKYWNDSFVGTSIRYRKKGSNVLLPSPIIIQPLCMRNWETRMPPLSI